MKPFGIRVGISLPHETINCLSWCCLHIQTMYAYNLFWACRDVNVGKLEAITVGHDARGVGSDWALKQVEVVNVATGESSMFVHEGWIPTEKGATNPVTLKADGVPLTLSMCAISSAVESFVAPVYMHNINASGLSRPRQFTKMLSSNVDAYSDWQVPTLSSLPVQ